MCEVSVDDEGQQSEPNDGDRNRRDNWHNMAENWVQHEMMNGHKIENWVQNVMMNVHKSWNKRIWDIN